jgi:hypothetical protein
MTDLRVENLMSKGAERRWLLAEKRRQNMLANLVDYVGWSEALKTRRQPIMQPAGGMRWEVSPIEKSLIGNKTYKRIIHIVPSVEGVDLGHQVTDLDCLRESWPMYEQYGNVDLEHLCRPRMDEAAAKKRIQGMGMPYNPRYGKTFYHIGGPIPGSFDEKDCSFDAFIHEGMSDDESAANMVWRSFHANPPYRWKASIAGFAQKPVAAIVNNKDAVLGVDRRQLVTVIKRFEWDGTALTLKPMNHLVPVITAGEM